MKDRLVLESREESSGPEEPAEHHGRAAPAARALMTDRRGMALRRGVTVASSLAVIPPLGDWLTRYMTLHMLVQIPLLFSCAAMWGARVRLRRQAPWLRWNLQGAPGLLFSALILAYWMTPIALDHAAADWVWNLAKIGSLAAAGLAAGISWRLSSVVTRSFYAGNMLWMTATVGLLYQESDQRLCNAYLWNDQLLCGQCLLVASVVGACIGLLVIARTHGGTAVPGRIRPASRLRRSWLDPIRRFTRFP
jgi:hypothetical protein